MMTEDRVGFLFSIASNLSPKNETYKFLRSHYLMRCNELTKGYGLPVKHFSTEVRCPRCCLEWSRGTEVNLKPIKLSKSKRRKIKSQKKTEHNKRGFEERKALLDSNEMVQVCTFCKQTTTTKLKKPKTEYIKLTIPKEDSISKVNNQEKKEITEINNQKKEEIKKIKKKKDHKKHVFTKIKPETKKGAVANVYCNAFDVFSLKNEKNTCSSSIREPSRVIKNCKKKKDKFAGLCQKAVLASAKLKHQKEPQTQDQKVQNRLNLFLKPSPG